MQWSKLEEDKPEGEWAIDLPKFCIVMIASLNSSKHKKSPAVSVLPYQYVVTVGEMVPSNLLLRHRRQIVNVQYCLSRLKGRSLRQAARIRPL